MTQLLTWSEISFPFKIFVSITWPVSLLKYLPNFEAKGKLIAERKTSENKELNFLVLKLWNKDLQGVSPWSICQVRVDSSGDCGELTQFQATFSLDTLTDSRCNKSKGQQIMAYEPGLACCLSSRVFFENSHIHFFIHLHIVYGCFRAIMESWVLVIETLWPESPK